MSIGRAVEKLAIVCGAAVEDQQVAGRAEVGVRAGDDHTAAHRGGSGIGVCAGQRDTAAAHQGHATAAADVASEDDVVGTIEGQRAVGDDIARERTGRTAVADLQDGVGRNGRAICMAYSAGEQNSAAAR